MTIAAGEQLLHYRVIEKIGEGGMGVVWKASDTTLDREVAIKILPEAAASDPARLARFEREAKLLASLSHPNIAAIHGLYESGDLRFLAMELVEGEDLAARLRRGPLPVEEALTVCAQVAEALEAAHSQELIHRDLKPANVLLMSDSRAKVLDFGLAKALAGEATTTQGLEQSPTITSVLSVAGIILGTAAYMSPEQARGKPLDRRTDIWSFGCVLYECLTGKPLFSGETSTDLPLKRDRRRLPGWIPLLAGLLLGAAAIFAVGPSLVGQSAELPLRKFRLAHSGGGDSRPQISPDGRRVAVSAGDAPGADIWIHEVDSGAQMRLTFDDAPEFAPAWLPAGDRIGFVRAGTLAGERELLVAAADGSGEIHGLGRGNQPDFSPDGRFVAFTGADQQIDYDIWYAPLDEEGQAGEPVEMLETDGNFFVDFSPDGRLLVYASTDTGRSEIYITRFPGGDGKWQVSKNGGELPVWSPQGDRIFFRQGQDLMEAPVTSGASPSLGQPRKLFTWESLGRGFDLTPDGRQFVMIEETDPGAMGPQITVVQNWVAEFEKK